MDSLCYIKTIAERRFRQQGFSLLEMVFVLLMIAVLAGIGFAGAHSLWKGEKVESCARKLQSVMMRALRLSVANQQAYAVVVDATQVRLIEQRDVLLIERGEGEEVVSIARADMLEGVEIFIRRWQQREEWKAVELEVLNFPVSGICEPVRFRLVEGEDILEFSLHPLTAFPVDETLWVK